MRNHIVREQRIGLLSVVAALVMITMWWLLLMPAVSKYKVHRQEARLKEKLGSIRPHGSLAGVKPSDIQITRVPNLDYMSATRLDVAKLDCISGGTYYRSEFTNAGFGYNGETIDPKQHTRTFSFAGQGYDASVLCAELPSELHVEAQSNLHIYVVNMWPELR